MEILLYLLKVNLAITVFYLFYRICYRNDTFFTLRRYVLQAILILSVIYPLLDISHWFRQNEVLNEIAVTYSQYLPDFTVTTSEGAVKSFPYSIIPLIIYAVITGFFLIRLVFQLTKIIGLRIRSTPIEIDNRKAYRIQSQESPFSFFHWLFINPDRYKPAEMHEILTHELVHVRQHHSIDMLLSELICIFCWFNPFAWMLRNEIHFNLEFIVDKRVIRSGIDSQSYQFHLLRLANNSPDLFISNQFKKSPLKKRIIMLNSKQTSKIKLVTYSLLLPLAVIILIAVQAGSCVSMNAGSQVFDSMSRYANLDEKPSFPGGDSARVQFMRELIRYPIEAFEERIQGSVRCSFIVEKSGEITNIQVIESVDPFLDAEAIRVIGLMPRWNPGKSNGVAVSVKHNMTFSFRLLI